MPLNKLKVREVQKACSQYALLFETFSYIGFVEKGNQASLNDTVSRQSKALLREVFGSFSNIPLTGNTELSGDLGKIVEQEVHYLFGAARKRSNLPKIVLTPVLDSLLETSGNRFGLITITSGFTRRKGNYGGQIAKGAGLAVLTLGMYTQVPFKASSTMYAMIFDSKDNNVAFYKMSHVADKEPLDKEVVTKQVSGLFKGYF